MGMIVPEMGTREGHGSGLADALFGPVQQRVLALLFGQPDRRYQSAELIRLVGSGTGAVHRQLERLARAGLVTVERLGNQKYYQARRDAPVFEELHGLIAKTVGLAEPLRQALRRHRAGIRAAFVYGSIAKGVDRASSDIDLMVISDALHYPDLFESLQEAESRLGRTINPTVMTGREWDTKRERKSSFVDRIVTQPRILVIGTQDDISGAGESGRHRATQAGASGRR